MRLAGWWTTNMRVFLLGLALSAISVPCMAQTVLKSEPLVLAPYEIAYVQDTSCAAGKVLKVTGAIRGLQPQAGLRGVDWRSGLADGGQTGRSRGVRPLSDG